MLLASFRIDARVGDDRWVWIEPDTFLLLLLPSLDTRPKVKHTAFAHGKSERLTGDSLVCCFHGKSTPGGGYSKYSPGRTHNVRGLDGL